MTLETLFALGLWAKGSHIHFIQTATPTTIPSNNGKCHIKISNLICLILSSLVTQPMLQGWQNSMELRSMDSYIQIFCRFQICKQNVPPPSLPCTKKSPFALLPKSDFFFFFASKMPFGFVAHFKAPDQKFWMQP